ncbi:PREDICTED: membrane-spanning 4-domains subfamily A member 13 [Elephantulus edwardii]|uniref:membrane-spanning 4-domains subfamily A member 13 n=1 Tax=Elephantulus edwardii TaxID=28737 RepID=UPI0003F0B25B|nr:PREDICTED: membrane-spanning 4-domains subfamily A member 13 [Elephantulus edwardii]
MIGIFHVFMWYFVLTIYSGQIKGFFGIYEPITYKAGTSLWGVNFILAGSFIIRTTKHPNKYLIISALLLNVFAFLTGVAGIILTLVELSKFPSVSYRSYGQAKLGREVSRLLLLSYHLEIGVSFVYSLFSFLHLNLQPQHSFEGPVRCRRPRGWVSPRSVAPQPHCPSRPPTALEPHSEEGMRGPAEGAETTKQLSDLVAMENQGSCSHHRGLASTEDPMKTPSSDCSQYLVQTRSSLKNTYCHLVVAI